MSDDRIVPKHLEDILKEKWNERVKVYDKRYKRNFPVYDQRVYEDGAIQMYELMKASNDQALEAVRVLREALEYTDKTLYWYANTFAGWEENAHEFEHFWRVELPHEVSAALEKTAGYAEESK